MRLRQVLAGAACVAAAVTLARCGGDSATPPTTPTPIPTVAPTPTPTPGIVLPPGMVCDPTPPPLLGINAGKWRPRSESGWILDSNPIVPNVDHYCARVGFGEWRFCNTRPEGDEQRIACDYLAVGIASDTGRWGPTWTVDGMPCDGRGNCLNHSENQFKAIGKGPGYYEACASPLAKVYTGDDPYPGTRCGVLDWQ